MCVTTEGKVVTAARAGNQSTIYYVRCHKSFGNRVKGTLFFTQIILFYSPLLVVNTSLADGYLQR